MNQPLAQTGSVIRDAAPFCFDSAEIKCSETLVVLFLFLNVYFIKRCHRKKINVRIFYNVNIIMRVKKNVNTRLKSGVYTRRVEEIG